MQYIYWIEKGLIPDNQSRLTSLDTILRLSVDYLQILSCKIRISLMQGKTMKYRCSTQLCHKECRCRSKNLIRDFIDISPVPRDGDSFPIQTYTLI